MTNQQHPALFDWATELLDAEGHVTLSAQEAHEIGARLRSMGDKLKAYEDLDEAASDVQLLRMGYAAARLEIESLQARIKTMAEEHADELMVAHMDGRMRAAQPAGEYPELPGPFCAAHNDADSEWPDMCSESQMRTYADATCAMRAAQPASGLDPELGPMLDFANAGEIAFYDYAVAQHCRATLDILDGKDNGAGACNEPWASVRKRLLSIVELHQSSSASHGQAPAQAAPAYKDSTPELHVGDSTFENWYSTYNPAHKGDKQRARDAYAAGMGDPLVTAAPQQEALRLAKYVARRKLAKQLDANEIHSLDSGCDTEAVLLLSDIEAVLAQVAALTATQPAAPQQDADEIRSYAAARSWIASASHAPADSVLEDAARYRWLRDVGGPTWVPFRIRTGYSAAQVDDAIDAARKQGETNEH